MVAAVVSILLHHVFLAVAGHIHLATDDGFERFEPVFLALLVDTAAVIDELLDTEHGTMVGDGHAFHAVVDGFVYEIRYLGLPVENRVLGVNVEVNKIFHHVKKLLSALSYAEIPT